MRYVFVGPTLACALLWSAFASAQPAPTPATSSSGSFAPPSAPSSQPEPLSPSQNATESAPTPPPSAAPAAPPQPYPPGYGPPPGYGTPPPGGYPPPGYGYPPPGYAYPPPQQAAPAELPPRSEDAADAAWRPNKGGIILGVDRLIGVFSARASESGSSQDDTALVVDLAGNAGVSGLFNPFAVPQLSIHGVVAGGLSIGGIAGVASTSPDTSSTRDQTITAFTLGPRIGGVVPMGQRWAIWIKGGISYTNVSVDTTTTITSCVTGSACTTTTSSTSSSTSWTDLTIDPMFVYFPIPHVGLLFGPAFDIGIGATRDSSSGSSRDGTKYSSYGVAAGLAVFL